MRFLFCFVTGLAFGSFSNVYFYRLPRDLSLLAPNSFCPHCNRPILWFDNIPLVSFLLLGRKCRYCGSPISWQYPFVELTCGLIFLLVAIRFQGEDFFTLTAYLTFSFLLFLIAGIDIVTYFETGKEYGIIPDHLVWILAIAGLLFCAFNPLLRTLRIVSSLSGALGGAALMLSFRWLGGKVFKKEALGLGDVKMVGATGFWIGIEGVFTTLVVGSALGSFVGLSLLALRKIGRGASVPFGPFLALGSFSALVYFG